MSKINPIPFFSHSKSKLDPGIDFIQAPSFWDKWIIRTLIGLGIASLIYFIQWFVTPDHIGYLPLYLLLAIAIGFKILKVVHEWYHYLGLGTPVRPVQKREYTVDMLTTFCAGEPYEMIVDTLRAMVAVKYPHTTYLCDESDDPYLKKICEELGVVHVYRGTDKTNAKAGNINYALHTHAKGEIAVILDPDHKPSPDFLDRVLPYFNDDKVGYVQCVQAYKNRNESFVAKGAAQQTYHFYGPMMMSMHTYGTVQAIGANCTFRRAALDEIGGHAAGLSEDMHTSMQLHAKGWRSVYVPEALTRGLVPATLSGYYKQQLKWSRGTFELLVRVFPKLAFNFTFRQFIHYLTLPLYFLAGLITFIDLTVPILALLLAQAPWRMDINELIQHTLPLLTAMTLIRQYAQKWLLEEHERGFHLLGGALLVGTWWVFLVGLVYTIFRVKVPYIPTPKGDELKNEWKLSLPNIIALVLSLVAIIVGLSLDWSPYSMIMAVYAGINAFMLGFVVLISQQKLLMRIYRSLYGGRLTGPRRKWYRFRHRSLYPVLRNTYVVFVALIGIGAFSVTSIKPEPKIDLAKWVATPESVPGVVLTDVALPADESLVFNVSTWGNEDFATSRGLRLVPLNLAYSLDSGESQSQASLRLDTQVSPGSIPFLQCVMSPPGNQQWDTKDWAQLAAGEWDAALENFGETLAGFETVIYLHVQLPGSEKVEDPALAKDAWQYIRNKISHRGVDNLVWVWGGDDLRSFPGTSEVDLVWIDQKGNRSLEPAIFMEQALAELPEAFQQTPILLDTRSGGPLESGNQTAWVRAAESNPGIAGILLDKASEYVSLSQNHKRQLYTSARQVWKTRQVSDDHEKPLPAQSGLSHIEWSGDLIRGVVYNPSHDWRDGYFPLTRKKLLNDFRAMQEMGANTIRRYFPGIYDKNLLSVAEEVGMDVWYGFWLDPKIDYLNDPEAVLIQEEAILERVRQFQSESSIIAWNLGQESWTQIATYFDPLYVPQVRLAYVKSLERIATRIRQIDPVRPVSIALRDQDRLDVALRAHRKYCPSVDIFGINSFYPEHQDRLDRLMHSELPDRQYMLSEFGPGGYWDYQKTISDDNGLWHEPSDFAKAAHMRDMWEKNIKGKPGQVIGGFAFCWQDRLEGTATWYGLTDGLGNKKAPYYALKKAWGGGEVVFALKDAYLVPPLEIPGFRPYLPFWSVSDANNLSWVDYEWWIMRQDDLKPAGDVKIKMDGRRGDVMLPLPEGTYRIYMKIYDAFGHAVTASHGFQVTEEMNLPPTRVLHRDKKQPN